MKTTAYNESKELDDARNLVLRNEFGERYEFDVGFPIEWNFGDRPTDGCGGPAVSKASVMHVFACDDEYHKVGTLDLVDVVAQIIESTAGPDGAIAEDHVSAVSAIRDMLRQCADKLDAAMAA